MTPTVMLWRQPMVFVAVLLAGALAAESRHTSAASAAAAAQAGQPAVVTLARPQAVAANEAVAADQADEADEGASPADSLVADDLASGSAEALNRGHSARRPGALLILPRQVKRLLPISPKESFAVDASGQSAAQSDQSDKVDPIANAELRPQSTLDFSLPGGGLNIRQLAPTRFVAPLPLAIPEARNVPRR